MDTTFSVLQLQSVLIGLSNYF